jgi:transcriptional regulator with XRE-family HTH domain
MIKNEKQYQFTKRAVENFERELERVAQRDAADSSIHPLIRRAEVAGIESQIATLRSEIREYERLKAGERVVLSANSLADLPIVLVQARIAAGLSQEDLAVRLGMKKQQIQRYEADDYASASLATLIRVAEALGIGIREDALLPVAGASAQKLLSRLQGIGVDRGLVLGRILPASLRARVEQAAPVDGGSASLALEVASWVSRVFGLDLVTLFGSSQPALNAAVVRAARFKVGASVNESRLEAYAVYARYLAELVLFATPRLSRSTMPTDPSVVHDAIQAAYGVVNFSSILRYAWDLGIPVLPLNDPGAFHGATWRINGRDIVVLKQRTKSGARWSIDLLHELWHTTEEPNLQERSVIEEHDITTATSREERTATRFASNVVLNGQAEDLAQASVQAAGGNLEALKSVVPGIAERAGVGVGELANYLAFRLSRQGENWWGASNNLQPSSRDPWQEARDELIRRVDFSQLEPTDRDLLVRAMSDLEV